MHCYNYIKVSNAPERRGNFYLTCGKWTVSEFSRHLVNLKPRSYSPLSFPCVCVHTQSLCHVLLFATSWTIAGQAPPSMEFSRQEYWSRLSFPTPRHFPNRGVEPMSLEPPALAGAFFTMEYFSTIQMCY